MAVSTQNTVPETKCPSCGAIVTQDARFCLKCGADLTQAVTPRKPWVLRNLPWLLAIVIVALVGMTQSLFLAKGNETQLGVTILLMFLGFIVWIVGLSGFFIQLIRRKKKGVWGNIAFCAFAVMVAATSTGIYVGSNEEEPIASSNNTPAEAVLLAPPIAGNATAPPENTLLPAGGGNSTIPIPPPTQPISPPDSALARQNIPAAGGRITVNKPGSSLNGLQITVPAGAYNATTNFVITSFDPDPTKLDYAVASPVIEVENGGGYSTKPMTMKIPVTYDPGDFPTAFYVDGEGSLQPIPTVALDEKYITVEIYHFSMILTVKGQNIRGRELVNLKNGYNTTFRPGVDDWAFRNDGTYITQGGNCAGMSFAALYYFDEISSKNKGPHLHGLYPGKLAQIHEDDREAWRLVSLLQYDYEKQAPSILLTEGHPLEISTTMHGDEVTYKSFQTAMLITEQPQLIFMQGKDKKTGKRLGVGHAMIAYGFKDGLLVANPNYPKSTGHIIPYANGKLGPYETDTDPGDNTVGTVYDTFQFIGRGGAYLSWSSIGAAWAKVNDRSLGDTWYPEYWLSVTDDQGKKYPENLKEVDKVTVNRSKVSITISSPVTLQCSIYRDGRWTKTVASGVPAFDTKVLLDLKQGDNLIGIYIAGFQGADVEPLWMDFKWVTVVNTAPQVETWVGNLTGSSKISNFALTGTFNHNYQVNFTVMGSLRSALAGTGYVSSPGVVNGGSTVVSQSATSPRYANDKISPGSLSGLNVTVSAPHYGQEIWIFSVNERPIVLYSYSLDGTTYQANGFKGFVLIPKNVTDTTITGDWRTADISGYTMGGLSGTFTLNKQVP